MRPPPVVVRARRWEGAPLVSVRVWLRGGSRLERIPGQALVAGRLLTEGTRRREWRAIARQAEERGLEIASGAGLELQWLALDGLSRDWELALEWAAELVSESIFAEERFEWVRRQVATELASQLDHPELETEWTFLDQLYRPHPASRPLEGTVEGLSALSALECRRHHRRALASGAIVTVVGEIDERLAAARAESLFADRFPEPRQADSPPSPVGMEEIWRRVPLASGEQAHLFCGRRTVARADASVPALVLLGTILGSGGSLSGRLPLRLREREGLAYEVGVETVAGAGLDPGRCAVYLGTAPAAVERAAAAIREELQRVCDEGVTVEEVRDARTFLLGGQPFRRETARQWSELLAAAELYGQPLDRTEWVTERLRGVGPGDVLAAARSFLQPEGLRWTVGLPV